MVRCVGYFDPGVAKKAHSWLAEKTRYLTNCTAFTYYTEPHPSAESAALRCKQWLEAARLRKASLGEDLVQEIPEVPGDLPLTYQDFEDAFAAQCQTIKELQPRTYESVLALDRATTIAEFDRLITGVFDAMLLDHIRAHGCSPIKMVPDHLLKQACLALRQHDEHSRRMRSDGFIAKRELAAGAVTMGYNILSPAARRDRINVKYGMHLNARTITRIFERLNVTSKSRHGNLKW